MPFEAKAAAIERVIDINPALAATYIDVSAENKKAPAEITLRIAPLPDASRLRQRSLHENNRTPKIRAQ